MSKIVAIGGSYTPDEQAEAVISKLEGLLEMARAGRIKGFAAAVISADGYTHTRSAGDVKRRELIGALMFMVYDLMKASE